MQNKLKIFVMFLGCLLFRLLPLRAPNMEPIMASIMPLGLRFGAIWVFLFGFASIAIYDLLTHFGAWTFIAGISYGLVGIASYFYFKKFQTSLSHFVLFSIFATIIYDLITGVLFAPLFNQSVLNALIMQIPFTALHLAGNIGFAITLSPLINKWLISKEFFAIQKSHSLAEVKI